MHKQHSRGGYIVYRGSELQRATEKTSKKNVSWCISMFFVRYIFGCAEFFVSLTRHIDLSWRCLLTGLKMP